MADDVFGATTPQEASPVTELVGEGKKFNTIDELARGKLESDTFIEKLKGEQLELRAELEELRSSQQAGATAADVIKALQEKDSSPDQPQMTEEQLEQKVKQILQGESAEQTAKRNREKANALVLEKAGSTQAAQEYLAGRAKELDTTVDKLRELGEVSPKLFAKAVGVDLSAKEASVSQLSGVNTGALMAGNPVLEVDGIPNKAYFDKLRGEMGTSKFINDSSVQIKMVRAAEKLGSKFYS